jgi:predicted phosphodiesterase
MRLALLADIHSNQFALFAVLDHLQRQNVDQVIFCSDYAFGGSGSNEVIDLLMSYNSHPIVAISGNKEDYISPI